MVIDDTIEEKKPYTAESELVCWHYDHSKGRSVKGLNLISVLYQAGDVSGPVAFELVKKSGWVFEAKKGKWRRKSLKTKNELYRGMLWACQSNQLKFRYVLSDVWYSASENMDYIKRKLEKEFIMPLKSNRKVAKSPTKTIRTQSNHVFASIFWVFVKLERMKLITKMNHFALRSRLCVKAVQAAFQELQDLQLSQVSA